jgi:cell fate regulator YaaT (PSP1 superfamily)
MVIVDTVRGPEMAKVVYGRCDVPETEVVGELKSVLRHAEPSDFERMQVLQQRQDEVMGRCAEKIKEHNLPMDLVKAEYSFDGSRLTFYFISEQRVDFRLLVRDLARTFRSRIELRQIGPRDEAKLLGGIGPCGRLLCCTTFLPDYARVSIKMAKDQDLPLNPSKISGVCGRLLCCLSYEHQQYLDMKAEMPSRGDWVHTPDGPGDVAVVNVLKSSVTVRLASSGMEADYTITQIQQASEGVNKLARRRKRQGAASSVADYEQQDEATASELLRLLSEEGEEVKSYDAWNGEAELPHASPAQRRPLAKEEQPADTPQKPSRSSRRRRKRKTKKTDSSPSAEASAPRSEQAAAASPQSEPSPEQKTDSPSGKRSRPRRRKRKPRDKQTGEKQNDNQES